MKRRQLCVTIVAITAITAVTGIAYGLTCLSPAGQRADLELESVTVDGVPQGDLTAYRDLEATLTLQPHGGGAYELGLHTKNDRQNAHYVEHFRSGPDRGP